MNGHWDWGWGANPRVGKQSGSRSEAFLLGQEIVLGLLGLMGERNVVNFGLHVRHPHGLLSWQNGNSVLSLLKASPASSKSQVTGGGVGIPPFGRKGSIQMEVHVKMAAPISDTPASPFTGLCQNRDHLPNTSNKLPSSNMIWKSKPKVMCEKLSKILTLPSCLHQIKKPQSDLGKGMFFGLKTMMMC